MRYSLGLHREEEILHLALLHRHRHIHLDAVRSIRTATLPAALFSAPRSWRTAALSPQKVVLRQLTLPTLRRRDLLQALAFSCSDLLPYPPADCIIAPHFSPTGLRLQAITKQQLTSELDTWHHLDPHAFSSLPNACWRLAMHAGVAPSLHLRLQSQILLCVASDASGPLFCHTLPLHRPPFLFPTLSLPSAPCHLPQQLARCYEFLKRQRCHRCWQQIFLSATDPTVLSQLHRCVTQLLQRQKIAASIRSDYRPLFSPAASAAGSIAIGLALEGLAIDSSRVNFRQGPFAHPAVKQRQQRRWLAHLASCCLFASSALLAPHWITCQHRTAIQQRSPRYALQHLPTVSEVLSWLEQLLPHPAAIVRLDHRLCWPPLLAPSRLPQVHIRLEMEIPSATAAAALHQALQKAPLIDRSRKISWKRLQCCYRAQFFLKSLQRQQPSNNAQPDSRRTQLVTPCLSPSC